MDWTAANEQREDALLRVFFMLIAMVLLIVRVGLDARGALTAFPAKGAPDDGAAARYRPPSPQSTLYHAALTLLCAAHVAVRRLLAMARALYELINQAHTQALSVRGRICGASRLRERTSERLDTS